MYLDEDIDEEYEAIRTARLLQESEKNESLQAEMRHIFEDDNCADDSASSSHPASSSPAFNARSTRSGRILPSNDMVCEETQADIHFVSQPPVRKVKVCTEEIKSALSEVSVVAQISPEKARKAAQASRETSTTTITTCLLRKRIHAIYQRSLEQPRITQHIMIFFLMQRQ